MIYNRNIKFLNVLIVTACLTKTIFSSVETIIQEKIEDSQSLNALEDKTQTMFLFLDSKYEIKNKEYNSITKEFVSALFQKVGIIAVSGSIAKNAFSLTKTSKTDIQTLIAKTFPNGRKDLLNEQYLSETYRAHTTNAINLDKDWTIKKVTPFLYFFLSNNYLSRKGIDEKTANMVVQTHKLTEAEKMLGLKINHLETVDFKTIASQDFINSDYWSLSRDFKHSVWNNSTNQSNIFVTNRDQPQGELSKQKEWVFLISGHASTHINQISGIALPVFKEFLKFCEQKIFTRLFYYISCFATGMSEFKIFNDKKDTYSFPIITQSLPDVSNTSATLSYPNEQGFYPLTDLSLFQKKACEEILDFDALASSIEERELIKDSLNNFPQIRFPGQTEFVALSDDQVISIGSVMANTRTKPLVVGSYRKTFSKVRLDITTKTNVRTENDKNPLGILVYTPHIPFEIIDNVATSYGKPPAIISMIPGNAEHIFEKLSSEKFTLDELIKSFLTLEDLLPEKIFFIKELIGLDEHGQQKVLSNVHIYLHDQITKIYFTYAENNFESINSFTNRKPTIVTPQAPNHSLLNYDSDAIDKSSLYAPKNFTQIMPASKINLIKKMQNFVNERAARQMLEAPLEDLLNDFALLQKIEKDVINAELEEQKKLLHLIIETKQASEHNQHHKKSSNHIKTSQED